MIEMCRQAFYEPGFAESRRSREKVFADVAGKMLNQSVLFSKDRLIDRQRVKERTNFGHGSKFWLKTVATCASIADDVNFSLFSERFQPSAAGGLAAAQNIL